MTIGFHIGASTNVGVQREVNQDSYAIAPRFAVVADGMGGHRGGEVASSLAVQEMVARFVQPDMDMLVKTVEHANRRILDTASNNPQLHGMGTTVVALGLVDVPDGVSLGAINVGDSRMYRLTGNVLEQLTEDHSLVEALVREGRITAEQAEVHPQRNIVTRALGVLDDVEVDSFHFIPKVGDRYLLCSDGLFNEVTAQEIATLLDTYSDPQEAAEALVSAANAGGGRDNITTVIVDIVEGEHATMPDAESALASPANLDSEPSVPDPTDDAVVRESPDSSEPDAQSDQPDPEQPNEPADHEPAEPQQVERQRWSWRR